MRGFVRTLGQKPLVLYIGYAIAVSKSGFHTPLPAGIGRLPSISNMFTIRIVGAVELSS